MGTVTFPDAESVSLQSITIPNMVPNIYNGNDCFIYFLSQTINTTAGVNDNLKVKDIKTGIIYNVDVGTILGTPATFASDLVIIQNAINLQLPNSVIVLSVEPAPPAGQPSRLQVGVNVGGNAIQFLKNSNFGLVFGVYNNDSDIIKESETKILPDALGGVKVQLNSYQYTYDQLIVVLQNELNASIAPGSFVVSKNSIIIPSEPYDDRMNIQYTQSTTELFYIGSKNDGSTMSPSLGYVLKNASIVSGAIAKVQLFGIKEYYLHCRQTNRQKVQLSKDGKLVSIHAVIPKTVGYGGLLTFTAPNHDFFRIAINRGSNQMKTLTFTLRDVEGNRLIELDNYEYAFMLDIDLIEK
jgi:hypothetical protein